MKPAKPTNEHWHVPRWPAILALLAIGGIYLLVSEQRTAGPSWLLLVVLAALLIPHNAARLRGHARLARWSAFALLAVTTLAVSVSAALLVLGLLGGRTQAPTLLRDASLIWIANVLAFALWYWELDGGGPAQRHWHGYDSADFVFPQVAAQRLVDEQGKPWSPTLVDYLFLAFNTSTALSPSDTMVLSRRAKLLMMVQSFISLVTIVVLAARAINTL